MSRREDLLRAAADALEAGRAVPVWSLEDGVPASEVFGHAEDIALAIRVYLALPKDERTRLSVQVVARQAIPGPDGERIAAYIGDHMRLDSAARRLKAHRS